MEAELFTFQAEDGRAARAQAACDAQGAATVSPSTSPMTADRQALRDEAEATAAARDRATLAAAFVRGFPVFDKALRYQTSSERSMLRAIDKLTQLQEARITEGLRDRDDDVADDDRWEPAGEAITAPVVPAASGDPWLFSAAEDAPAGSRVSVSVCVEDFACQAVRILADRVHQS
jgi:hypothetical protein